MKSAYFEHYYPFIAKIFETRYDTLLQLDDVVLKTVLKILKVENEIRYTTDFEPITSDNDLRYKLAKGDNGQSYPAYYQVFGDRFDFIPNLCVLDLIFNEGPASLEYLKTIKL